MFVPQPGCRCTVCGLCLTDIFDMICWPVMLVVFRSERELWACLSGRISLALWSSVCVPWFGGWVCV